jgi:hypothetical protein
MQMQTDIEDAMSIVGYFEQPDTPAARSPVGVLMLRIIAKNPGIDFESARTEAHNLLWQAAGRKRYVVPAVLSPQEKAESVARMRERFQAGRANPSPCDLQPAV